MPEEGAGLVREIGYKHMPLGSYTTMTTAELQKRLGAEGTQKLLDSGVVPFEAEQADHEFAEVMHEFEAGVRKWEEAVTGFNKAYGIVNITQEQPGLKRINWEIHWLSDDGIEENFKRNFWLHEGSLYWEQYGRKDFSFLSESTEGE